MSSIMQVTGAWPVSGSRCLTVEPGPVTLPCARLAGPRAPPGGSRRLLTNQMNILLILGMGRISGVTAGQTRERLLCAAADVFARRGYDGTRVADIAAAAGVSNG